MRSSGSRVMLALLAAGAWAVAPAHADDQVGWSGTGGPGRSMWEFQYSPYTLHFNPDPTHQHVVLVALAHTDEGGRILGGALFRNSFAQPCAYAFFGRRYVEPFGWRNVYWTWTAGIIYGYKPPHEHKVPLNWHGFSPVVVPTVGYQLTHHMAVQAALLGTAGMMFSIVLNTW